MDYKIVIARPWQYRHRRRGYVTAEPGTYLVPEQMEPYAAELAVLQGMAVRHEINLPAIPVSEEPETEAPAEQEPAAKPTASAERPKGRRGRRRRKGPAPENKIVHAPENKQALL